MRDSVDLPGQSDHRAVDSFVRARPAGVVVPRALLELSTALEPTALERVATG